MACFPHHLAVDRGGEHRLGGVEVITGREYGSERGRVLPHLALKPFLRPELPAAHRDVVGDRVPGDRLGGFGLIGPADLPADDDDEFTLPVELRILGRERHVFVRAGQRLGELREEGRVRGQVAAHLEDVVAVVEPHAHDLAGAGDELKLLGLAHGHGRRRGDDRLGDGARQYSSASRAPTSEKSSTMT